MKRKLTKNHKKSKNTKINQMIGKYKAINPIDCTKLKDDFKNNYQ